MNQHFQTLCYKSTFDIDGPNRQYTCLLYTSLITNFTEFVFYKQEDIDDYLSVLESVPAYIEGALEVTRTQVPVSYTHL